MYLTEHGHPAPFNNDTREVVECAYGISNYLHHSSKIPPCQDASRCSLCINAARLVIQREVPKIKEEIINRIQNTLGWRCGFPHGGDD